MHYPATHPSSAAPHSHADLADRVFELAWTAGQRFADVGWAGLSDAEAGAMLLSMRSGPIEKFLVEGTEADRLTGPKFALLMLMQSGGAPCRISIAPFLPNMIQPMRIVARPIGSELGWDEMPDLDAMGAPGTGRERDMKLAGAPEVKEEWRTKTVSAVLACEDTRGVDPEALGRATAPLRQGLRMDAADGAILLCALLQVAQRMRKQKVATMRMRLVEASAGSLMLGDVEGVAWLDGGDVPDPLDDVAPELDATQAFRPETKLQVMVMNMVKDEQGVMQVDGFRFHGEAGG